MYLGDGKYINCKCDQCGAEFHRKESDAKRKGKKTHFCNMNCFAKYKETHFCGENNHQYGLRGSKNPSWKSDLKITNYGYKKIRVAEHPFADCDGFVFEHRLIAEKYLLNDENSVCIDGEKYLDKKYEVHHINEDRFDNRVENLLVLTKGEHVSLHNSKRVMERDKLGRFLKTNKGCLE